MWTYHRGGVAKSRSRKEAKYLKIGRIQWIKQQECVGESQKYKTQLLSIFICIWHTQIHHTIRYMI